MGGNREVKMTVPAYLATFRRAVRKLAEGEKREVSEKRVNTLGLNSLTSLNSHSPASEPFPFAAAFEALERRCPEYIEPDHWQRCIDDAQRFLADWGDKAATLGWTADELFGLHLPPAKPHPSYNRLSRYDCTGLLWGLEGRRVVALSSDTAAVENPTTGNVLIYRKHSKPGLGPMGDNFDDFIA
jgi:hypothetical protein